ncbi:MAG: cell division protein ZapA [Pseudomonadota bacterium]
MSEADDPVSVRILDKEYLIACRPEEKADLQRAAGLLNTRLRETRESSKAFGTERVLMMTALNMANDLAKLQARDERLNADFGSRVKTMRERVERALVQGQQLEL